jgi:hypothetical protein
VDTYVVIHPGFVPLSTIVAIQFVPLLAICAALHLAADRLQPAGRPDLRALRDFVRGGGNGDTGGFLT